MYTQLGDTGSDFKDVSIADDHSWGGPIFPFASCGEKTHEIFYNTVDLLRKDTISEGHNVSN